MSHTLTFVQIADRARRVMIENGFVPDFPPEVEDEVRSITIDPNSTGQNVLDLRDLLWSSIDNKTSRDLDQVEFAEMLDNGDIRLLVGIADVDGYISQGSATDKHAAINTVSCLHRGKDFSTFARGAIVRSDIAFGERRSLRSSGRTHYQGERRRPRK